MFNLRAKLKRTRESLVNPIKRAFERETFSEEDADDVEEMLLGADLGVEASEHILDGLRNRRGGENYRDFLRGELLELLATQQDEPRIVAKPHAMMVVGINGVGKTTTIAKLARHFTSSGETVLLGACDTFRAAATEQLAVWAERVGVDVVRHQEGGDPAAVAFDTCSAARSRNVDKVILDTAGRLHTKVNLMEELKKIKRVAERALDGSVETLLVLDATLGQNSLAQAREFTKHIETDGIILTKMDSTARGGIVVAVGQSLGLPVRYIGLGEGVDDLQPFDAEAFVDALVAPEDA